MVQETIKLGTPDEVAVLEIAEGTTALTKDGEPLEYIKIEVMPEEDWPEPPAGKSVVAAFGLGPNGANFDPPLTMTVQYDLASLPEGVAEEDLVMAYYDSDTGQWQLLPCEVDTENNIVTAQVHHFTEFAILGKAEADGQNGKSAVWSPPPPTISWSLVGGISAAVVLIGLCVASFLSRQGPTRIEPAGKSTKGKSY